MSYDRVPLINDDREKRDTHNIQFYDNPHGPIIRDPGEDVHDSFMRQRRKQKSFCKLVSLVVFILLVVIVAAYIYFFLPYVKSQGPATPAPTINQDKIIVEVTNNLSGSKKRPSAGTLDDNDDNGEDDEYDWGDYDSYEDTTSDDDDDWPDDDDDITNNQYNKDYDDDSHDDDDEITDEEFEEIYDQIYDSEEYDYDSEEQDGNSMEEAAETRGDDKSPTGINEGDNEKTGDVDTDKYDADNKGSDSISGGSWKDADSNGVDDNLEKQTFYNGEKEGMSGNENVYSVNGQNTIDSNIQSPDIKLSKTDVDNGVDFNHNKQENSDNGFISDNINGNNGQENLSSSDNYDNNGNNQGIDSVNNENQGFTSKDNGNEWGDKDDISAIDEKTDEDASEIDDDDSSYDPYDVYKYFGSYKDSDEDDFVEKETEDDVYGGDMGQ